MKKRVIGLNIILFIFLSKGIFAKSLFILPIGNTELQLEMIGLYYLPLDWSIPLTGEPIPKITPRRETDIYKHLLTRLPSFIVFEASTYPLPLAGLAIKQYAKNFYESTTYFQDFNLIESITTSRFEEPWAASIFFGNVVNFVPLEAPLVSAEPLKNDKPDDDFFDSKESSGWHHQGLATRQKQKTMDSSLFKGKGFSGLLISYGNYHIKKNSLIKDNWIEAEAKLIGYYSTEKVFIDWSYRLGIRYNFHPEIKNYIYIGIKRDHTDYTDYKFSFIKNSQLLLKLSIDMQTAQLRELRFLAGKKFPMKNSEIIPEITLGVIWKITPAYSGSLVEPTDSEVQYVISPNIRF